ncbi:hypothetical protein MA16_Dca025498 [Dendrobium catenatum]|uniref:Uncharacterized protein n=1 Tax=Dendrobium catenatum TaxID=906689 RepID=A0A2I0VUW7_9ASPA|nr:hypothetical protein MA16_Dca025498 [Dendrobium catenatum]
MYDDSGIRSRDSGISEEKILCKGDGVISIKGKFDLVKNPMSGSDKVLSSSYGLGGAGAND